MGPAPCVAYSLFGLAPQLPFRQFSIEWGQAPRNRIREDYRLSPVTPCRICPSRTNQIFRIGWLRRWECGIRTWYISLGEESSSVKSHHTSDHLSCWATPAEYPLYTDRIDTTQQYGDPLLNTDQHRCHQSNSICWVWSWANRLSRPPRP